MMKNWCPASGQQRSLTSVDWVNGGERIACPDCGRNVRVYNATLTFPYAKVVRHKAISDLPIEPYAHYSALGQVPGERS